MKKKSFLLILTCIVILLLMDNIYRPYIYSRGIFDFFIADSFPSLMGPIILSAYVACTDTSIYKNKIDEMLFIITLPLGLIAAEFIAPIISRYATFDIMDVVFTALGGVIVYFLKRNLYDKWYNALLSEDNIQVKLTQNMCSINKKCFILIITCIVLLLLMDNIYRPYIYSRGIFDFFIADSFPSLMGPIILSAYTACTDTSIYKNKIDEMLFIITLPLGLIAAEFIAPIISRHATFDIMDVVFTALGGVIVYFVKKNLYDKWYNTIKVAHTI